MLDILSSAIAWLKATIFESLGYQLALHLNLSVWSSNCVFWHIAVAMVLVRTSRAFRPPSKTKTLGVYCSFGCSCYIGALVRVIVISETFCISFDFFSVFYITWSYYQVYASLLSLLQLFFCFHVRLLYAIKYYLLTHARRSLSTVGGTHCGQSTPPTTVLLSFTFILPPRGTVQSLTAGVEQSHELNLIELAFQVLHMWPSWLDYRVPTTPCTSRLKTKKTKNSFNLSRKYCMDKK